MSYPNRLNGLFKEILSLDLSSNGPNDDILKFAKLLNKARPTNAEERCYKSVIQGLSKGDTFVEVLTTSGNPFYILLSTPENIIRYFDIPHIFVAWYKSYKNKAGYYYCCLNKKTASPPVENNDSPDTLINEGNESNDSIDIVVHIEKVSDTT
jgi:hypothetical protein